MAVAEVLIAAAYVAFFWMISDLGYSFEGRERGPVSYIALAVGTTWIGLVLTGVMVGVTEPSSRRSKGGLFLLAALNLAFVGAVFLLVLGNAPWSFLLFALPPAVLAYLAHRPASGEAPTASGPELLIAR